jgi:colicin import membrane protein
LVAALTWGVSWRHQAQQISVEAELWASVPQQAAPRPVASPTPPKVEVPKPDAKPANADIVVEREKKQEPKPVPKVEPKPEKPKVDPKAEAKRREEEEAKQAEDRRNEQMQRIAGLAGATGGSNATGSALQSAGPSATYAGRIRARIKPNIVFSEDIAGNPAAEVEVRAAPDGTIVARKLIKSSGNKSWDDAVLKAIDKTEVLPRDTDGRVPSSLVISFRPKD